MSPPSAETAIPRHFAVRMWAFFAGFFFVNGIGVPFFPMWLENRGFSDAEIAAIIALPMAFRVLLAPLGGFVADRTPTRRFAVRLFILPSAGVFVLAWFVDGFWPILLLTGAAFTLWQLALPGGEALALTGARRFGVEYGRMRLGASMGFIVANLVSGAALGLLPVDAIFWFMAAGLGLATIVSFILPTFPRSVRALDDALRPERKRAWTVLANPGFLALLVVGGLIQASHAVFYSFGGIYWRGLGYSTFQVGGYWSIAVASEMAVFFISAILVRHVGPIGMLALAAVAATVRWSFLSFDIGALGFAAIQALHGFSYGAAFLGNQHAIARAVPDELTASAQGLYLMVSGLLMAGMTALAGPLYASLGPHAFLLMTALPLTALVLLGLYWILLRPSE